MTGAGFGARPEYPELLILRHGETEWNRAGRLQGALDSPLTDRGRGQAQTQNRVIAGFGAAGFDWYASPQGRAMTTARIVQRGNGGAIAADARLREIGMGRWTGLRRDEIAARAPHLFAAGGHALGWYDHAPGGEGLAGLARRVAAFLDDLGGPAVIVTHGITSRVMRCLLLGLPVDAFGALEGGQGVVYRLAPGIHQKLTLQGAADLGYPKPGG